MGWVVNLGDTTVAFDDLSPDVFAQIAAEDSEANWWGVYKFPGGNPARLYRVIVACANHAGIEPPGEPANMRDAQALLDMLGEEPDVDEQPMVNDFPQTPATPESSSTSGVPGDSDGPGMSPVPTTSASS